MDHYDPVIRAATARVLGRLRQRDAGDRLLVAVDDSSESVRLFAVEALGFVREDRALPKVRDLIARAGKRNVDGLTLTLARIGAPDDLAYFKAHLADRSAGVRRAAAEGIGRIGDRASVGAIDQLATSDRAPAVRLAAAFALHRLGRSPVSGDRVRARRRRAHRPRRASTCSSWAPRPCPAVQEALKVAVLSRHRADLIQAIGYLGSAADLPMVQPLLRDPDERVQRAANAAVIRLERTN